MRDVGVLSQSDALSWGYTGPILRSTGLPVDLRKDTPYLAYAELDFEVPVGIKGDNYDRYYVRMREIDESIHMIRQCVDRLEPGPINVDDRRCVFPEKTRHLEITVDLVADMTVVNPFDFFVDDRCQELPFSYPEEQRADLAPFLALDEPALAAAMQGATVVVKGTYQAEGAESATAFTIAVAACAEVSVSAAGERKAGQSGHRAGS